MSGVTDVGRHARFDLPWMPPAEIVRVEGRGEFFVRRHQHPDPDAPTVMLLHGWTASADLQFFTAYRELAEHYLVHRHRPPWPRPRAATLDTFAFDDVADDHVAVARQLGIERAVLVGYSMGGPIALTITPPPSRLRRRRRGPGHGARMAGDAS